MRLAAIALACLGLVGLSCGGAAQVVPPTASPSPAPAASASAGATSRVEGVVATAAATRLTLVDNTALELTSSTRIIRTDRATVADLKPGIFVAITARQQPDSSLLASMIHIFPASVSSTAIGGQRPLPQGDLMTNASIASIDQVSGSSFTVTFPGGSAKVLLATGAVLTKQTDVEAASIAPGTKIVAMIRSGVVQSIQIQAQ